MDIVLLVEEYLSDKTALRDYDNDSFAVEGDAIVRWDFKNIPCPTPEELLALQPTAEAKATQEAQNLEALKYLADTDWYVIREMDSGVAIPENIKTLRAEARLKVVR